MAHHQQPGRHSGRWRRFQCLLRNLGRLHRTLLHSTVQEKVMPCTASTDLQESGPGFAERQRNQVDSVDQKIPHGCLQPLGTKEKLEGSIHLSYQHDSGREVVEEFPHTDLIRMGSHGVLRALLLDAARKSSRRNLAWQATVVRVSLGGFRGSNIQPRAAESTEEHNPADSAVCELEVMQGHHGGPSCRWQ